jgi:hypothetical protein
MEERQVLYFASGEKILVISRVPAAPVAENNLPETHADLPVTDEPPSEQPTETILYTIFGDKVRVIARVAHVEGRERESSPERQQTQVEYQARIADIRSRIEIIRNRVGSREANADLDWTNGDLLSKYLSEISQALRVDSGSRNSEESPNQENLANEQRFEAEKRSERNSQQSDSGEMRGNAKERQTRQRKRGKSEKKSGTRSEERKESGKKGRTPSDKSADGVVICVRKTVQVTAHVHQNDETETERPRKRARRQKLVVHSGTALPEEKRHNLRARKSSSSLADSVVTSLDSLVRF